MALNPEGIPGKRPIGHARQLKDDSLTLSALFLRRF
jgi:hypothetical protein